MIVGGQTEARAQLSSTIIDYHEPFDQGFSPRKWARARTQRRNFPQAKLDSEKNCSFSFNEHGDLYFYCIIIVYILSS